MVKDKVLIEMYCSEYYLHSHGEHTAEKFSVVYLAPELQEIEIMCEGTQGDDGSEQHPGKIESSKVTHFETPGITTFYKGGGSIKLRRDGTGCLIKGSTESEWAHFEVSLENAIENFINCIGENIGWYIAKINDEEYSEDRMDMENKITGLSKKNNDKRILLVHPKIFTIGLGECLRKKLSFHIMGKNNPYYCYLGDDYGWACNTCGPGPSMSYPEQIFTIRCNIMAELRDLHDRGQTIYVEIDDECVIPLFDL